METREQLASSAVLLDDLLERRMSEQIRDPWVGNGFILSCTPSSSTSWGSDVQGVREFPRSRFKPREVLEPMEGPRPGPRPRPNSAIQSTD